MRDAGDPHFHPPVMEELKEEARARGLWNLFLPDPEYGPGLTNVEYAPLAEIMGRSHIAPGGVQLLRAGHRATWRCCTLFGTDEQKERWLRPLLDGEIRSGVRDDRARRGLAPTPRTSQLRIERDGDDYVLNGRKWWTSGAMRDALPDPDRDGQDRPGRARRYQQQSMVLVPLDTPGRDDRAQPAGVRLLGPARATPRCCFEDVRVPASNLIAGEGDGFMIAQARLGPGRIHHCMRAIGAAERALELMCQRALAARDVRQAGRRRARTSRTGSPSRASRSRWSACSR